MSRTGSHPVTPFARGVWVGLLATALIAMFGMGCGNKADGKPASGPHAQAGGGKPGGPPAEPPTHVAVNPATRGVAQQRYTTTATLEAENRAELLARANGVVAKFLVEEGDVVKVGQTLLLLDDSEAKVRVRQAEVELAKQKTIFDRQKASFEQQVIAQSEFDLARTNYEAADAALELAKHQLSYAHVAAPFSGTVVRRVANVGQTVNVGSPLFEIANFKPLLARIFVPAKELGTLREGQEAEISLDSNGDKLRGAVRLVSPVVDPSTGTVKVTVGIHEYPEGTRPGDFVHVSVVTARHENAIRVPNMAVFEDRGERVVYVANDSLASRRPVQVGFMDETHTEVISGLETGDRVIVKGQRTLKDGARIRILEEEKAEPTSSTVADRAGA